MFFDSDYLEVNATIEENGTLSYYAQFKSDQASFYIRVAVYRINAKGIADAEILNKTVNVCNFLKRKDRISKMIFENIFAYGFLPKTCPMKRVKKKWEIFEYLAITKLLYSNKFQGIYYLKYADINTDIFPPYIPEMKTIACVDFFIHDNNKKLKRILTQKFIVLVKDKVKRRRY